MNTSYKPRTQHRRALSLILAAIAAAVPCSSALAQTQPAGSATSLAEVHLLPNGFELSRKDESIRVTTAREGVFRVQIAPAATITEVPSWAVIANSQAQPTVKVTTGDKVVSFASAGATVKVDRQSLAVTVLDAKGRVITQDAPTRQVEFHGSSYRVFKSMPITEHFFGLGDKTGPTDHRDEAFTMWNTDAYHWQEATDPLYKSIPFFLALHDGISYGIFLDDTWRSSFDFGKEYRDIYSFGAEAGALNYYIVTGDDPKEIVRRYTELTGRPPMPPRWALGFQQSRWSYYPESRVREIAQHLRQDKIPADVLYLDIDYQDHNRPFTVDKNRFPHFEQLIADLREQHFHTILISDLHIATAPKGEYAPFDAGVTGDHFLHNPDGSLYVGEVWPGPSAFPEFTQASSRAWMGSLFSDFYLKDKIGGFWNDMNEPSVFTQPYKTIPLGVLHRIAEDGWQSRTTTHAEVHNVFGMLNSRATYEGMLKISPNQRPFVLTRASYAGGQRYAATWTGDNSATWNHMRIGTHQLVNLGLSGFAFSGNDVGGYAGSPSMDLLTRWLEVAAFAPIDRDHTEMGTADQEPWVGGPEHEAIRRHYIEERYRLMPYIYTLAEEASREGIPLMRPLFLEFPQGRKDNTPLDVENDNQFLFGPALMVAPAPFPDTLDSYYVKFPENSSWFDYWTGQRVSLKSPSDNSTAPPQLNIKHPELGNLPVFARAGSILPRQPLTQNTDEIPAGPLELRVYLPPVTDKDSQCKGNLYTDDGVSFAFRQGEYYRATATCTHTPEQTTVQMSAANGRYKPWWTEIEVVLLGVDKQYASILLNGKAVAVSSVSYGDSKGILRVKIPATFSAWTLKLQP